MQKNRSTTTTTTLAISDQSMTPLKKKIFDNIKSDKMYWQVADSPMKGYPKRRISSRATQLGKEDFDTIVIIPTELRHTST